jgi:hypothetical protein
MFLKSYFKYENWGILAVRPELVEGLNKSFLNYIVIPAGTPAKDGGAATVPYGCQHFPHPCGSSTASK